MTIDYNELYVLLTSVSDRTLLYKTVRAAMIKRGHYKHLPRGKHGIFKRSYKR